jgi:putative metallohydrolase (TIGR04338 family)
MKGETLLTDQEYYRTYGVRRRAGRPKGSKNRFPSDTQRKRLYQAENEAGARDDKITFAQASDLIHTTMTKGWFRNNFHISHMEVKLRRNINGAACVTFMTQSTITFSPWALTTMLALHELAHAATPPRHKNHKKGGQAGHGPEYAGTYIYLVEKIMGQEQADRLRDSFRNHNVEWTFSHLDW